ncbi:MAG: glycosyltransferase family 4 protein, partial [Bacteroidota bacterium]
FVDSVMPLLPPNVQYWLAGDGPENDTIREAVAARGLEDRVRLLGTLSEADLSRLYRGADLFVMPNVPVPGDMEGFGIVMLEAGLGGLPVVAARLEGIQDVVAEGLNGHFIESGDAWAFSERIAEYVYNRERLDDASERALSYVREHFGWDAVANRYVDVLADRVIPSYQRVSSVAA